jgi:hypothetical protein
MEWRLANEPVLYRYVMGPEFDANMAPHWMAYFDVDPSVGVDATVETAVALGGTVVAQPYNSPWGRIAVLADLDGATFSVIDHALRTIDHRAEVDDLHDD